MNQAEIDKGRYLADFSLLLTTVVWGLSFTLLKYTLGVQISPLLFVFVRFLIASLVILPLCAGRLRKLDRKGLLGGIVLGAILFFGFATQSVGIQYTTASKSAFITGLSALFVPVFLFLHKRRLPGVVNGLAILVALVGMNLLTNPTGGGLNKGDLLTLACAVGFGAQIYVMGIVSPGRDFLSITFIELTTTAAFAAVFMPLEELKYQFTVVSTITVIFLSVLATAGALLAQTWAQQKTSAVKAGLIYTAEPVFAYMFASVLLEDFFEPIQKIGGALIVIAVVASEVVPLLPSMKKP